VTEKPAAFESKYQTCQRCNGTGMQRVPEKSAAPSTDPAYDPNSVVIGRGSNVKVCTRSTATGCQAVEWDGEWAPCGLPVFAVVYGGDHDGSEDLLPRLCWRHLVALCDTGTLIVRPARAESAC
jgi:hypothetical protein